MDDTAPTAITEPAGAVRRLTRTHDGRWLAGVSAGLGRYFGISPTIYRLAFVALASRAERGSCSTSPPGS